LLDAVKDKKARDAVRSVLERLTGGARQPPPDAAETPASAPAATGAQKSN
jgi:AsmA protein